MMGQVDRCAGELADARVDAIGYACLVAVMARGPGEHEKVERQLGEAARRAGGDGYDPATFSSTGASTSRPPYPADFIAEVAGLYTPEAQIEIETIAVIGGKRAP